ncbi:PREDICTED: uncharacterized protein LOC104733772 [Camelina sativa]|uniref:Uncharacterized protein LOC104733772 n=1 Tax=Camelina sativa TaxID=90675 RepID=A0ABM1QQZ5_CAMSA|nr:PREDICTED: uncharacterized protein LOC104733772 [Camelina sativa]
MASSSRPSFSKMMDEYFDNTFDNAFDQALDNQVNQHGDFEEATNPKKTRVHIERKREEGDIRLWNDYFSKDPVYSSQTFRRCFRMNKGLFMRIVERLSTEFTFFQQRRDATGKFGFSTLQKTTAAIRMMAYGCPADALNEYLRLAPRTALSCLEHFVERINDLFGDEYLRRPTPEDLQQLLDIGELRGFPGMIGSIDCTLNDINVLDRSPVFDDILHGQAPKVKYSVNSHEYRMAYYLTDGIYPEWATFVQSIPLPQDQKASLFAQHQEFVRKDVERAFGVLQARFAIVRNRALFWDKAKIGKIMRACIILHNMIVEDERDGYTQFNVLEFAQEQSNRTSQVDATYSVEPSNLTEMMITQNDIRDRKRHRRLKADLVENI